MGVAREQGTSFNNPIALGFTDGVFLVDLDIKPGRYRVQTVDDTSRRVRLDANQEIIDNDLSDGATIVMVKDSDWVLEIRGVLEVLPPSTLSLSLVRLAPRRSPQGAKWREVLCTSPDPRHRDDGDIVTDFRSVTRIDDPLP